MSKRNTRDRSESYLAGLVQFFEQSGVTFPGVDIFCAGSAATPARVAALIEMLGHMRDKSGRFIISRIVTVLPASSCEPVDKVAESQLAAVLKRPGGFATNDEAAARTAFIRSLLRVVRCPDLEVVSAVALIEQAEPFSVVVVLDAAKYREAGLRLELDDSARIPEDLWSRHLQAFAKRAVAAASSGPHYVVLDAGQYSPLKPANIESLRSVDGCGVLGGRAEGDPAEIAAPKLREWAERVQSGRIGSVFSEIDALPETFGHVKQLLKIQLLGQTRFHIQMLELLREEITEVSEIAGEVLVRYARFAQRAGDSESARAFLGAAVSQLDSEEDLELACGIASDLDEDALDGLFLARLEALFPNSPALYEARLIRSIGSRKWTEVAEMASSPMPGFASEEAEFYRALAVDLSVPSAIDYLETVLRIESRWPLLGDRGRLLCAADARARGRAQDSLGVLLRGNSLERRTPAWARACLRSVEQLLLDRHEDLSTDVETGILHETISALVDYLAENPDDGDARGWLTMILSPKIGGNLALFVLARVALERFEKDRSTRRTEPARPRQAIEARKLSGCLEPIFNWMRSESPIAVGRVLLPMELLTQPVDDLLELLRRLLEGERGKLRPDSNQAAFENILMAAVLIAPHSRRPDEDLVLLRLGASRLARAGRVQRARDLAEHALQTARQKGRRSRLAWHGFADVYQRLHNPVEGLLGIASALSCEGEMTLEESWYETYLLIRLFRDLEMWEFSRSLLPVARALIDKLGPEGEQQHRFTTLELGIRLAEFSELAERPEARLREFVADSESLCRTVLERGDETAPAAALLAEGISLCRDRGIPIRDEALRMLELSLKETEEPLSAVVRTLAVEKIAGEQVLDLARSIQPARYAIDTGFDLRYAVKAARRLLDAGAAAGDSIESALAIELLADHALRRHGGPSSTEDALHGVPQTLEEPAELAKLFSNSGILVVLAGISARGDLVHLTAGEGFLGGPVRESQEIFSRVSLGQWSKKYPYAYGDVDETDNLFYTSMRGLGLTVKTGRMLFVMDSVIAQLPANLLIVSGEFVGRNNPVAVAPSLAWLRSARASGRKHSGQKLAWIPVAAKADGNSTLSMIAGRLAPTLSKHSVPLETGSEISRNVTRSALVIVAAHGGVVPEGRYFRVVSDDADLRMSSDDLARSIGGAELVVLFVCSSGRFDRHPFANTTIGLARDLISRGSKTVIASPWPLHTSVPAYWLPRFLELWDAGSAVIDANFEANKAVEKGIGDLPGRCLAMSVFGDPMLVKHEIEK